ncbi:MULTISPECIES: hypothetical protein [unclassified Methylobacterium]|uniref:hypothetical protein n=1 Tax=unclassified Methylobacterium TaxID=2615210 RepID=UPI000CAB9C52|nr:MULTISPECIES: hypothetical protein [unclassified Methylobacterium]PIU06647.1 MAG: hypothetical protein COT56_08420 [Methylobacterium sp. CG09_land_8_20_14_0_10_71_15]PIU12093.1 MAG: hypothetical protein COT28_16825 [Methylobacterium sp. CG08_land_8_20_14_0_20_71_15]GBU19673.1 hypothetical protein AwMethylo_38880 [Methylobacterium sp.]
MSALDYLAMLGPIAFVAAFLLTPWGQGLAAFLLGTRLGRWISIAAVVVYAGLVAYAAAFRSGKRAGAADALRDVERANAAAVQRHQAIEAKVARTPDQALRDELKRWAPVLLVGLLLGGCVTTTTGGPGRGGAWCDVEQPIRLSPERIDAMTPDEVKAAVAHNRHGAAECGWAPGRKS